MEAALESRDIFLRKAEEEELLLFLRGRTGGVEEYCWVEATLLGRGSWGLEEGREKERMSETIFFERECVH